MDGRIYLVGSVPWRNVGFPVLWCDADEAACVALVQVDCYGMPRAYVRDAVTLTANAHTFNPVKEYLNSLPEWDSVPRLGTLFARALGAEQTEFNAEVERLLFRGLIRRTFEPGCKLDYVFCYTGPQGLGKSSLLRMIAGRDEFFCDSLTGALIDTKDGAELVQGKWLIEVAELAGMSKRETDSVKGWLTRQDDEFRAPYGHFKESHPRRFVVCATTNKDAFLRDGTGNRRWLVVTCGVQPATLDIFGKAGRDFVAQTWAQAWHEYGKDESPLILPGWAAAEALAMQERAAEDNPNVGLIGEYLEGKPVGYKACAKELAERALQIEPERTTKPLISEIREIMNKEYAPQWRSLEKKARCGEYGTQRCWERVG